MRILIYSILILCFAETLSAQSFTVVPLGVKGGSDESNLSAYAVAAAGTENYVCLDAGTVNAGVQKAVERKTWKGDAHELIKNKLKGYLISHPHLDHVSGLIINAPEDSPKPVYGIESCLAVLQTHYFSWKSWANFGNAGEKPTLNKYTYTTLTPEKEVALAGTSLFVTPFLLSHVAPTESTAFLIRSNDSYILYLGDTGSDRLEKSEQLKKLWQTIAPLINTRQLKAIFSEVSFPNDQPDNLLFGHLTPKLLMEELSVLSNLCEAGALTDFPVLITHMKPGHNREKIIKKELQQSNTVKLKLVFPEQGKLLKF